VREKYLSRTQWEGKVKGFRDKEGVCNNTFASSKEISTSWKFKQEVILSFKFNASKKHRKAYV